MNATLINALKKHSRRYPFNKKIFFSLPAQLLVIIIFCVFFGDVLPVDVKSFFLSLSLFIKSVLLFCLPLIVFGFVFHSFARLDSNVISFALLLVGLVCLSNFSACLFSYGVGLAAQDWLWPSSIQSADPMQVLPALFNLTLPKIGDPSIGLAAGAILGFYTSWSQKPFLQSASVHFYTYTQHFLQRWFVPIVPLFVFGFILKMQHEQVLPIILHSFAPLLIIILGTHVFYLIFGYWMAYKFQPSKTVSSIKNILPAVLVGFSSMSSATAMPVLATGTSKNLHDPKLAQSIIPSTINTHMLGDALAIPLIAFFFCLLHHHQMPSLMTYVKFALAYTVAKFAASGVPGGTIIVMLPVLESYLGFTPQISSTILMVYMLFDPFCTAANVLGNGLLPVFFEKLWCGLKKKKHSS